MKVYTVTMYRWGDRERHSYLLGAFTKKQSAIDAGRGESVYRGGKYSQEVLEIELDKFCIEDFKVIEELKQHPAFAKEANR